jgi:flagellar protein FlaG
MEIRPQTSAAAPPPPPADKSAAIAARNDAAPTQTVIAAKQAAAPASEDEVSHALKSINHALKERSQDLEFSIDDDSDRTIVKVVDKSTQEVIRQMPTEEALEIAKALDRLQSLLVKQSA